MNYIETCTKIAVFFVTVEQLSTSNISSTCPRPGWIIYQNMRETWEKKVMKFEREIPIGLDARRKKWQGGGHKGPPPPNGIRVKALLLIAVSTESLSIMHGNQWDDLSLLFAIDANDVFATLYFSSSLFR